MTFTTRPELRGTVGMVASTHWLASAAGMGILERGGNAFDAAVAAGLVLQVVEPHLNGPGGEVPIIVARGDRDEPEVICGQGVAPAAATPERFAELGLDLVPGTGLLPACVPGAFDAWMLLARDHGTLPLDELMAPAIAYAQDGFPAVAGIAAATASVEELLREEWPSSAEIWLPGGAPPAPGALLRNPALAATYRRIAEEARAAGGGRQAQIDAARDAFYRGFVAEAVDRWLAGAEVMDSSGERHRGLLTGADLAGWSATVEPTVSGTFRGWTVHKTGPWGQGPGLLQELALLDGFDLDAMDPAGAELAHVVVECCKLALADREAFYGDPDFADVPLAELVSAAYADERRALVGEQASRDLRPGAPGGHTPVLPDFVLAGGGGPAEAAGAGEPTVAYSDGQGGDTCHLDVADRYGNVVSATPSGGWLHGSPAVPGLGFCLGTRAQMFWLQPGLPNSLAPGKRPRTTLTPSLGRRDDGAVLAFGTPGGDMQDQWALLFLLRHAVHGMNLQEAIDAPMFHSNHAPSSFWPRDAHPAQVEVEDRLAPGAIEELRRRGHDVEVSDPWSLGRVSAAGRDHAGILHAAANPRGMQGYAVGR
jgi:gamma-glutamyltranspeptidase / glutathione hydrolase